MRKNIINLSGVEIIALLGEDDSKIAKEVMNEAELTTWLDKLPSAFKQIKISDNLKNTFENRLTTYEGYVESKEIIEVPNYSDINFSRLSEFDSKIIALFSTKPDLLALNLSNATVENSKALSLASVEKISGSIDMLDTSLKNDVYNFCQGKDFLVNLFDNMLEGELNVELST